MSSGPDASSRRNMNEKGNIPILAERCESRTGKWRLEVISWYLRSQTMTSYLPNNIPHWLSRRTDMKSKERWIIFLRTEFYKQIKYILAVHARKRLRTWRGSNAPQTSRERRADQRELLWPPLPRADDDEKADPGKESKIAPKSPTRPRLARQGPLIVLLAWCTGCTRRNRGFGE